MVRTFLLIAIFILAIACINFMNLSTARSERRAKEVGIRKTVGALKESLEQFLWNRYCCPSWRGSSRLGWSGFALIRSII